MIRRGFPAIAWASPSRCLMPPEYALTFRLAANVRLTRSSSPATNAFLPPGRVDALQLEEVREHRLPGEVRVEPELLREIAQLRPDPLGLLGDVLAVEHHAP